VQQISQKYQSLARYAEKQIFNDLRQRQNAVCS
jgi:hypothetical protein